MAMVNQILNLTNVKDSQWLTLEVCREFLRSKCTRTDTECKYAHPPPHVEVQNGRVTACFDSIKGKCQRKDPPCKYLHPPQHLKEILLQNGRNNLYWKNLRIQAMAQASTLSPMQPYSTIPAGLVPIYPGSMVPKIDKVKEMNERTQRLVQMYEIGSPAKTLAAYPATTAVMPASYPSFVQQTNPYLTTSQLQMNPYLSGIPPMMASTMSPPDGSVIQPPIPGYMTPTLPTTQKSIRPDRLETYGDAGEIVDHSNEVPGASPSPKWMVYTTQKEVVIEQPIVNTSIPTMVPYAKRFAIDNYAKSGFPMYQPNMAYQQALTMQIQHQQYLPATYATHPASLPMPRY